MSECGYIKSDGAVCTAPRLKGKERCLFHDPDHVEALRAARKRGGMARLRARAAIAPGQPKLPLRTVQQVIKALEATFNEVRCGELDPKIAQTLGSLAGHLLKALQANDLEELASELRRLKALVNENNDGGKRIVIADRAEGAEGNNQPPWAGERERPDSEAEEGPFGDSDGGWDDAGPLADESSARDCLPYDSAVLPPGWKIADGGGPIHPFRAP